MTIEYRCPTTEKVDELIQAHADLLEQHGISGGLASARPAAGTVGRYYLSIDAGVWARDNGTSWDEVSGLSEIYIQGLIDASISSHASNASAHHTAFDQADHDALPNPHHPAPTYDAGNKEVVFEI